MNDSTNRPWLRVLDAQSGDVTDSSRLSVAPRCAASVSPSGRYLVYASPVSPAILLVSQAGNVVDSAISPGAQVSVWVGDSAVLAYAQPDWRPGDLLMHRVDAQRGRFVGEPTTLLASLPEIRNMTVDGASGTVWWVSRAITDELSVMPLPAAAEARVLTRSLNAYIGNAVFSPDGQRLAYTRQDALGSNAYSVDIRTGVETALTTDTLSATVMHWPVAKQIIRSTLASPLLLLDLATGRSRTVALPSGEQFLVAGGNTRLMAHRGRSQLIWRDSFLQRARPVPAPPGLGPNVGGALSRDGVSILHIGATADGALGYALFNTSSFTWSRPVPLDTIALNATNLANDGTVYFTRFTDRTEIWRMVPGRPVARFATLPGHCFEGSITVSDDGAYVSCNVTTILPDVWTMALPRDER